MWCWRHSASSEHHGPYRCLNAGLSQFTAASDPRDRPSGLSNDSRLLDGVVHCAGETPDCAQRRCGAGSHRPSCSLQAERPRLRRGGAGRGGAGQSPAGGCCITHGRLLHPPAEAGRTIQAAAAARAVHDEPPNDADTRAYVRSGAITTRRCEGSLRGPWITPLDLDESPRGGVAVLLGGGPPEGLAIRHAVIGRVVAAVGPGDVVPVIRPVDGGEHRPKLDHLGRREADAGP